MSFCPWPPPRALARHAARPARLGVRYLFEESSRMLLCGDLFTQPGASHPALTSGCILGPSEAMRSGLDYWARAASTRPTLERLASLLPTTLACMHGSAWTGDGAGPIRELADRLEVGSIWTSPDVQQIDYLVDVRLLFRPFCGHASRAATDNL